MERRLILRQVLVKIDTFGKGKDAYEDFETFLSGGQRNAVKRSDKASFLVGYVKPATDEQIKAAKIKSPKKEGWKILRALGFAKVPEATDDWQNSAPDKTKQDPAELSNEQVTCVEKVIAASAGKSTSKKGNSVALYDLDPEQIASSLVIALSVVLVCMLFG